MGGGRGGSRWWHCVLHWSASRASAFSEPCPASQKWEPPLFVRAITGAAEPVPSWPQAGQMPPGRWVRLQTGFFISGLSVERAYAFPLWAFGCFHLSFFLLVIKSNQISSNFSEILFPGLGPAKWPLALGTSERDSGWHGGTNQSQARQLP